MSAPSPTESGAWGVVALALVAACATTTTPPISEPPTTALPTSPPPAPSAPTTSPPPSVGFDIAEIEVAGSALTVWVADTPGERGQGLRDVAELPPGIDGMLFVWDQPTTPTFGMRDTLIDLDIWWFDPEGTLIGKTEMDTCPEGECASHPAPGAVSRALETPRGAHEFEVGDRLTTSESG